MYVCILVVVVAGQGLLPVELDHHAMCGKISRDFFLLLVVGMASKEKSGACFQHDK